MSHYGNIMNVIDFQNQFRLYQVFSLQDIRKTVPGFSYRQLDRWEKKNYLQKIRRGFYMFPREKVDERFLFVIANRIYSPSYISLERALKFYGLIPEEVFQVTSVSTKKPVTFSTSIGNFTYRKLKPSLFWGYTLLTVREQKMLIAEPEKAILDYLYLHPELKTVDDFMGIRINTDRFREQVNLRKLQKYLEAFQSKSLVKRAQIFLSTISNDSF